jgi:S-DNA-T family DNA segregation ATPase FtsK/SpoIIIE
MAYQARQRDPLFDRDTQAVLEKRGTELLGLLLLALGVATAMIVGSYSPDDPSWLSATDEPARNLFGRLGASIASPLFVIVGYSSWAIAAIFGVWGVRLVAHIGEERILGRIIFAPIGVALAAVYASTHVPGPEWGHSFGLGGLFGDTVLGAILGVVPVQATMGLKVLSFLMFFGALAMMLFVLGTTRSEIRGFAVFLLRGIVMLYDRIVALAVWTVRAVARAVANGRERRAARAAIAEEDAFEAAPFAVPEGARVLRAGRQEPPVVGDPAQPEEPRTGLLARVAPLLSRKVDAGEIEQVDTSGGLDDGDRIKARISDVIRSRHQPALAASRNEPPVTSLISEATSKYRGKPDPMILDTGTGIPPAPTDEFDADMIMPEPELVEPEPSTIAQTPVFETGRMISDDRSSIVQHTPPKRVQTSRQAKAEAQPSLNFGGKAPEFKTPPLSLLESSEGIQREQLSDEALEENARMLENVLDDYGVKGEIVSVRPGPVVTMYELEPAPGLKASRVIGLADDIARSMSALSARVSTVPGRSVIGIELPNEKREKVVLREILSSRDYGDGNQRLPLALGKDIGGDPVVANLAKMPHLLIAGTTGSGKSVAINTMILSLLYKLTPEECRMIMIDPKMLELSVYDGIPHLLSPVVTDPKKAVVALKWVVGEMEERYRKMSKMGVRNIEGHNGRVKEALAKGEMFSRTVQTGFDEETGEPIFETEETKPETMPFIVVIVDEMADLMMVAGKEIEACIQRLAQMARASGIHLIMATQRPSVDVITGTIKANFPTRISFQVTSKVDSRTILGEQGAEQLLGMGDMLYMAGGAKITRVHGPFVSDEEVEEIVNHLKSFGPPEYIGGVVEGPADDSSSDIDLVLGLGGNTDGEDALYDQAVGIVIKDRKCSTSYIQRKLAIGYNKAARLVEQMEEQGLVSAANHVGKREILVPEQG